MSVSIVGSAIAEEAVGDESYLKSLVTSDLFDDTLSLERVIDHILQSLQKRLSKYKYIVQATTVPHPGPSIDADAVAQTLFGAAWESKRDGYITVKYEADKDITFITIYWVYAD